MRKNNTLQQDFARIIILIVVIMLILCFARLLINSDDEKMRNIGENLNETAKTIDEGNELIALVNIIIHPLTVTMLGLIVLGIIIKRSFESGI